MNERTTAEMEAAFARARDTIIDGNLSRNTADAICAGLLAEGLCDENRWQRFLDKHCFPSNGSSAAVETPADSSRPVVSAKEFLAEYDEMRAGLWGSMLMPGGGYLIKSGPGGVGKTITLVGLHLHLAAGAKEFLGFPLVGSAVPVLVLEAEGARPPFRERMKAAAEGYGFDLASLPVFFHRRDVALSLNEKLLGSMMKASGARAVLLDPIGRFFVGEENSAAAWRELVTAPLGRLAREHDAAFSFADHYVKPSETRLGRHKTRGSGAKFDDCGAALRLEYGKGGKASRVLFIDRVRDGAIPEPDRLALRVDLSRGVVELDPDSEAEALPDNPADARRDREKEERALRAQDRLEKAFARLEKAGDWNEAEGVSERRLAESAGLSRNGQPFERALAGLEAQKAIERVPGGGWRRVRR
jgi:hypothetical protein